MIHREDAVGAIIAGFKAARPGEVYNVTDNEPVPERDFFSWLAQKLKREMPPAVSESELASRKRGVTSKRVSNRRLREQLGYALVYPTFREGYSSEILRLGLA
jgi:nucleoside-diphosphate-sugar epimerase